MEIYNAANIRVLNENKEILKGIEFKTQIPVQDLSKGVYTVKFILDNRMIAVKKLIIGP